MTNRRRFLESSAALMLMPSLGGMSFANEVIGINPVSGEELQTILNRHTGTGNTLRIERPRELVCLIHDEIVGGEKTTQALLVPEGTHLDLQGGTLLLDCRSNGYGVRLSNHSSIRNGTIRIVRSEGKGSQGCWHGGINVGAAYGEGGTTEKPGQFSTVRDWAIDNITVDQPFDSAAIQMMSEACHGRVTNVTILDSSKALLGIGMDWGSVGPITTEDKEVPRMRRLWDRGEIYSTHPHDILIENLKVGRLTRSIDGNDAAVRCSACHDITIRNVEVNEAGVAVAIFGGDFGYEFARNDQREFQHRGYLVENVRIGNANIFGIILNGAADNIYRAGLNHGYTPVRDPVHPGIDQPVIRDVLLKGGGARTNRQGVYAVAVRDGKFERVTIREFGIGIHVEDWVDGLQFEQTTFSGNTKDAQIEGATEPAKRVSINA